MPVYDGPIFHDEINDLESLSRGLLWLSNQGFIPSFMDGPQSVGTTLKRALNMTTNSLESNDGITYKIKCNRRKSKSKITGFTKSPVWLSGWNSRRLLSEFGYKNNKSDKSLMMEIGLSPNRCGLSVEFTDECIFLYCSSGPFAMYLIQLGIVSTSLEILFT